MKHEELMLDAGVKATAGALHRRDESRVWILESIGFPRGPGWVPFHNIDTCEMDKNDSPDENLPGVQGWEDLKRLHPPALPSWLVDIHTSVSLVNCFSHFLRGGV